MLANKRCKRFKTNTNKNYEDILKTIGNDVVNIDISEKRINRLVYGLNQRIDKLKKNIENSQKLANI